MHGLVARKGHLQESLAVLLMRAACHPRADMGMSRRPFKAAVMTPVGVRG
jgi:hypothetical protein